MGYGALPLGTELPLPTLFDAGAPGLGGLFQFLRQAGITVLHIDPLTHIVILSDMWPICSEHHPICTGSFHQDIQCRPLQPQGSEICKDVWLFSYEAANFLSILGIE